MTPYSDRPVCVIFCILITEEQECIYLSADAEGDLVEVVADMPCYPSVTSGLLRSM